MKFQEEYHNKTDDSDPNITVGVSPKIKNIGLYSEFYIAQVKVSVG